MTMFLSAGVAMASPDDTTALTLLQSLELEMRNIVSAVAPSVVTIRATRSAVAGSDDGVAPSMSVGSGIVLDSSGLVMTVPSVVAGADDYWIETSDGRLFQAVMVGASDDVAVLQARKGRNFVAAPFGETIDLGVGSFVAALGNSYGFAGGAAWGEVNGFRPDGTIQLALGVTPGNTGGAVVNSHGLIVGMIRAKVSEPFYLDPVYFRTGEDKTPLFMPGRRLELPTSPVSLAVPAQVALREARRILEAGTESRAYVGLYVDELSGWYALHFKTTDGVLVTGVVSRTPAEASGLKQGDVITSVDRVRVTSVRQFRQIISQATPGQRLHVDILRGGQSLKLVVEAGRSGVPHLTPTDGAGRPFPFSASSRKTPVSQAAAVEVTPPPEPTTQQPTTQSGSNKSSHSTVVTKEEKWGLLLDAMRHTIDSLKEEVLILQQEINR